MCGIAGKFSFDGSVAERALIEKMCAAIVHRGPDAEGILIAPYIGLGQRRLSIIDLSEAAVPPLCNEDASVWLVFNGEIYNFQALRDDLQARGHVFRTRTDTEVIIHLYEEFGEACVSHLRGMFAFALWDGRRKRFFAARDRVGKKPFFYCRKHRTLTFASSVSALLADPDISVAPNFHAIDEYLCRQYVPAPITAFEGVEKLPAAHYLICDSAGKMQIVRYWAPPIGTIEPDLDNREEARREILESLQEAVRLRMVSDVPLGALLSGGIDSGALVALMSTESGQRVKTFSVGFEGDPDNELPYARYVAERYDTDHHEFLVNTSVVDALPSLVRHYGEPFADSSAIPTYFISQMARQHVTVALSGDGGDESFSGYSRYGELLRWRPLEHIPVSLRSHVFGRMAGIFRRLPYGRVASRLARACRMAAGSRSDLYTTYMSVFKDEERAVCYRGPLQSMLGSASYGGEPASTRVDAEFLDWMMNHDQHHYLPDCLMVKADVASMAHGLELRSPFLDHEFMRLAARIPASLKRRGMQGKLILRETVSELLPEEVLNKRKTGFGVPLAKWFRSDLGEMLNGVLLDDRAVRRGLFDYTCVRRMVDEQIAGRQDWSNRLWALLFLELWFREFID